MLNIIYINFYVFEVLAIIGNSLFMNFSLIKALQIENILTMSYKVGY